MSSKRIFLFLLISQIIFSQEKDFEINFLPTESLSKKFVAYEIETGTGLEYKFKDGELDLRIGSSPVILSANYFDFRFSASSFFLVKAKSVSYKDYILQIDCADGFFGGCLDVAKNYRHLGLIFKLRILHWSAHLVDGHYDIEFDRWIKKKPRPYSRDFGELFIFFNKTLNGKFSILPYVGFSNSVLLRPSKLARRIYHLGGEFDVKIKDIYERLPYFIFIAFHFNTPNYDKGKNNLQLLTGVRFSNMKNSQIEAYFKYVQGNSYFGQYFDAMIKESLIGIRLAL